MTLLSLLLWVQWPFDTQLERLNSAQAVFVQSGETESLFFLDRYEGALVRIDVAGGARAVLAKSGQGPGHLKDPYLLSRVGDQLYVTDALGVESFDLAGKFIKSFSTPASVFSIEKMKHGWVGPANFTHFHGHPMEVWWFDDDFSLREKLYAFPAPATATTKAYNPAASLPQLLVSESGETCFIKPFDGDQVFTFNAETREKRTLPIPGEPIPYDPSFATQLAKHASRPLSPHRSLYEPPHFPLVYTIGSNGEQLAVKKWPPNILKPPPIERLIKKGYILAYTSGGDKAPVTVATAFPGKVLSSSPDHTVFLLFNQSTESFWVHREPPKQAMAKLAKAFRAGCPGCP